MATEEKELAGRPISGTVWLDTTTVDQKPFDELIASLDAVFAFPEVRSIEWDQYTPYYLDGCICVFTVDGVGFRITGADDFRPRGNHLDLDDLRHDDNPPKYQGSRQFEVSRDLHTAITACSTALESGAYHLDLRKHFGDPATVLATREGFAVEYYDPS
ncbi:hypothetical protein [Nocardia carnea]|uniref:hypothetical protein n=1 Tax=Nocardia carnea TaxID=37328 RepID=UPI002454000A|nr:hypothetical protein [Nocardia carnea]